MNARLELQDVHVSYGDHPVIRGVNLSVAQGEFCALLGLNGSGKTTLLHAICHFIPMTGDCRINGRSLAGLHEKQRAQLLSFIPQVSTQMGGRSVLDVVLMGLNPHLGLFDSPSAQHRIQARKILMRLGVGSMEQNDFGTLSQGQKQMITLARCMIQDTPVLLMDEPDSALDFLNRHKMLAKIRAMILEDGRAGLITLHDPNFAMAYCDRLILLKDGKIVTDLAMHTATQEDVQHGLQQVYGKIELLCHNHRYLMVQGKQG